MHRAAKLGRTSLISDGFQRHPQPLSSPPPQGQVFAGTKDSAGCTGPVRWPGEVGGINCGGDMGVRRCLARFLTSLALLRTPKSANGPRSNSFRPDSPLRQPTIRGRKAQPAPHTTPNMARSVRVPHFQLKSTTSIHLIRNSFSSSLFFVSCAAATIGSHCSTYCLAVSLFLQKILRYKSAFF